MLFPVLHDFGPKRGMTVMAKNIVVAVARYYPNRGVWQLRLYHSSWANTMTNESQAANYARQGLRRDIAPNLTSVKTYREARRIFRDLAGEQHVKATQSWRDRKP